VTIEGKARWLASTALPILLILATAWVSRYLRVFGFGLDENDLTIVLRPPAGATLGVAGKLDGAWPKAPVTCASMWVTYESR
jgi:hypothetical protein